MDRDLDVVELELFRYAAACVVDEMEANLTRTAYSPLIYEYKDYCVAILDRSFRLITQSRGSLPIFLGDLGAPINDAIVACGGGLDVGDVVMTNYTPVCGQHINNVVMATPLLVADEPFGYVAVRAHWADLGGLVTGSMSWAARDVHQEGMQFRGLKVVRAGRIDDGVVATIQANSRLPEYVTGDLMAQIAACDRGRARWAERVTKRWSRSDQERLVELQWEASRRAARAVVASFPDGDYSASCHMDDAGVAGSDPIDMVVGVQVRGSDMVVDLSGMPPQVAAPINAGGMGGGVTAVRVAYKSLVAPERPADEGLFDCLSVRLAPGTVIDAVDDAPMGHWNTILPTLIDLTVRALAPAAPDRVPAGHHATLGTFMLAGKWPNGSWWQLVDTNVGGWGASASADGFSPLKTMFHGDNRDIPVEQIEARFPLRVESYTLVPDSGGRGRYRGGLATEKTILVTGHVILESAMDRTLDPAWGLAGGGPGTPGDILVQDPGGDGAWRSVKKGSDVRLAPGTRLRVRSGGGGGWGDPTDRPAEASRRDREMGYVSGATA